MKNTSLYLLLVTMLGLSPVVGATTMSGAGAKTCSAFMEGVKLKSDVAINGYISWAQGFISGFNWSNVNGRNVAVDSGSLTYWLVDYCGANPSTPIYDAMQRFIGQNAQ